MKYTYKDKKNREKIHMGVVGHVGEQKCIDDPHGSYLTWKSEWPTSYITDDEKDNLRV